MNHEPTITIPDEEYLDLLSYAVLEAGTDQEKAEYQLEINRLKQRAKADELPTKVEITMDHFVIRPETVSACCLAALADLLQHTEFRLSFDPDGDIIANYNGHRFLAVQTCATTYEDLQKSYKQLEGETNTEVVLGVVEFVWT